MATRLREVGLDPELIDAQLGHAEIGSETFGDTSTRCWIEDEPVWRKALEEAIAVLEIQIPGAPEITVNDLQLSPGYRPFREAAAFGRQARRISRDRNRLRAREQAHEDILTQLAGRPPESLNPDQWSEIGRSMLIQAGNRPHSNASIRYEAFEHYVNKLWRDKGLRVPLRQRFYKLPVPRTGQSPEALHAHSTLTPLRQALDRVLSRPVSLQSVRNAGFLAALDLALTSAVTDPVVLDAVSSADASRIGLVVESRTPYIDFREKSDNHDRHPARRFILSARAAGLLNKALRSKSKAYVRARESEDIQSLIRSVPGSAQVTDRTSLLAFVIRMVERESSLRLPGLAASVLAGRTPTYALPHVDWIRAKHGKRRRPPQTKGPIDGEDSQQSEGIEADDDTPGEDLRGSSFAIGSLPVRSRPSDSEVGNRELLGKVRRLLRHLSGKIIDIEEFEDLPAATQLKNSNNDTATRRAVRSIVRKLIKNESSTASYSVRLLAAWTVDLLDRNSRKGGGKLRPSSILRYLSALSSGFMSYGSGVDLRLLSESQLTDFYLNVIDSSLGAVPLLGAGSEMDDQSVEASERDEPTESASEATARKTSDGKANQAYVLERLVEFHRFASSVTELAEPDWSEIGDGLSASTVSTGFITPQEYLEALATICPDPMRSKTEDLISGFILLLTYRFGLRAGEAISLGRPDWVEPTEAGGSIVVLVTTTHSAVKTSSSRRQVPLMGDLTERERTLIDTWLAHWQAECLGNTSVPLFYRDPKKGGVLDIEPFRRRILAVLRALTGSETLTLHKARHSFANIVAMHVLAPTDVQKWTGVGFPAVAPNATSADHARVVVGSARNTRRRLWAVGRALGHSSPTTTCGSYLHLLGDWCAELVAARDFERFRLGRTVELDRGIDLDRWEDDAEYLAAGAVALSPGLDRALTPELALELMRSMARGVAPESAGLRLDLHPAETGRLVDAVLKVACQSRNESPLLLSRTLELTYRLKFLQQISHSRWDALREIATSLLPPLAAPDSNPMDQVAGGFQVLAFRRSHLENIRSFLQATGSSIRDVRFFRPSKLDAHVASWAREFGFPLLPAKAEGGAKTFQLAVGREFHANEPSTIWPDRISMVRSTSNDRVSSQAELAVLWIAHWSSQVTPR